MKLRGAADVDKLMSAQFRESGHAVGARVGLASQSGARKLQVARRKFKTKLRNLHNPSFGTDIDRVFVVDLEDVVIDSRPGPDQCPDIGC